MSPHGRGAVGVYNTGNRKANGVIYCVIYQLPGRQSIGGLFLCGLAMQYISHLFRIMMIVHTVGYIRPPSSMRVYFTPGTDCESNIIAHINSAQTIDAAVYSITNPRIGDAIISAHKRGARVRIITDELQSHGRGALTQKFRNAGIPVRTNRATKHKIEHNKWAVFDGAMIEYGSYNWTDAATWRNSESCLFFYRRAPHEFTSRFDYLWNFYDRK